MNAELADLGRYAEPSLLILVSLSEHRTEARLRDHGRHRERSPVRRIGSWDALRGAGSARAPRDDRGRYAGRWQSSAAVPTDGSRRRRPSRRSSSGLHDLRRDRDLARLGGVISMNRLLVALYRAAWRAGQWGRVRGGTCLTAEVESASGSTSCEGPSNEHLQPAGAGSEARPGRVLDLAACGPCLPGDGPEHGRRRAAPVRTTTGATAMVGQLCRSSSLALMLLSVGLYRVVDRLPVDAAVAARRGLDRDHRRDRVGPDAVDDADRPDLHPRRGRTGGRCPTSGDRASLVGDPARGDPRDPGCGCSRRRSSCPGTPLT